MSLHGDVGRRSTGSANEIAKNGLTWEAGLSFGSDVATIFGVGVLFKAEKCVTAATKGAKFSVKASTVAMTLDGGIAATRIGQGIYSVGWHGGDGALGYFGDAFLRLAGVSVQAIKRLRGPYCFVAGTPVHTEDGMRAVEEVQVGSRVWVWGYDRGRQSWGLCVVTGASRTDAVRVVRAVLTDGEELTGTPGHPVWVIEGENLDGRGRPDEGADEQPGETPGRWVGLAGLRSGDVLLTRTGPTRVSRVEQVTEQVTVYNLVVGGVHSYAVGARGVLAHNGADDCQKAVKTAGEAAEQAAKETPIAKPATPGVPAKPADPIPVITNAPKPPAPPAPLPAINKSVNGDMPHAIDQAVARLNLTDRQAIKTELQQLTKRLEKEGPPPGTILDPGNANSAVSRSDSILVPFQGGAAVYEIDKKGTARLRTVLGADQFRDAIRRAGQ